MNEKFDSPSLPSHTRMKTSDHFPSVRLAAAGFATLFLILWLVGLVDGITYSFMWRGGWFADLFEILITALISLLIIAILIPVLWHGPGRDRWLAGLLVVFPLIVFVFAALSALAVKF